jgi:pyruvate-formate lyase
MNDYVNGLYVKNGRLINDRPDSMTGIQKAAEMKKAAKRARKMEEIASGIRMAEEMKSMEDMIRIKVKKL